MGNLIVFVSFIYGLICGIAVGSERTVLELFRFDMSARLSNEEMRNARQAYFYGAVINTVFWICVLIYIAYQYLAAGE